MGVSKNMDVSKNAGFPKMRGTPKWIVDKGKSHLQMDDDWGVAQKSSWKPPILSVLTGYTYGIYNGIIHSINGVFGVRRTSLRSKRSSHAAHVFLSRDTMVFRMGLRMGLTDGMGCS